MLKLYTPCPRCGKQPSSRYWMNPHTNELLNCLECEPHGYVSLGRTVDEAAQHWEKFIAFMKSQRNQSSRSGVLLDAASGDKQTLEPRVGVYNKELIMLTDRCQMTIAFGSGEKAKYWSEMIEQLAKRYKVHPAEVVRIAVRTLHTLDKKDAVLSDKDA